MAEPMRLQKLLSRAGVASRRAAEKMILDGLVSVNGKVVRELGVKVDPDRDRVQVAGGRRLKETRPLWLALHKPRGYVSTRSDPEGRPTIYDLIPETYHGLFYVGRLDYDSEGLVLLTNQGDVAHRLLHPSFGIERVYEVVVAGDVTRDLARRLERGVLLDDGPARAHAVEVLAPPEPGLSRLRLTLREGRKREVRRMFEVLEHPVQRLVRVSYGPVRLGHIGLGEWRWLDGGEVGRLNRIGGDRDG